MTAAPSKPQHSTIETIESIVIAFILAFVFRAFVVEAFVIPTGSMAPTLLGQHVRVTCPECGHHFKAGPYHSQSNIVRGQRVAHKFQKDVELFCPMCDLPLHYDRVRTSGGDRILVLKYIYGLREPERWDVVVFKNPNEPDVYYIKRLVGLPGEMLRIVRGNVYSRPLGPSSGDWRVQRKTDRPDVQRVVWQPIYHSDHLPLDGGLADLQGPRTKPWTPPWTVAGGDWKVERGPVWAFAPASGEGTLAFDFESSDHYPRNFYAYNLLDDRDGLDSYNREAVTEMRLGVTLAPQAEGVSASLLTSGLNFLVRGRVEADGRVVIETTQREGPSTEWRVRAEGRTEPLATRQGTRLELWHADQSVSLWANGRRVAGPWEYELSEVGISLEALAEQDVEVPRPRAEVSLSGGPVVVRSLDLDRDLYYTQSGRNGGAHSPAEIPLDHFYCLGDNSPSSEDSRAWRDIDPWVQDLRGSLPGTVPREIMIGRAFFVYFPASFAAGPIPYGVPNFGEMRFIR